MAALLFAAVAARAAHAADDDPAHRIATLKSDDERLCVVAAAGYSPELRDGIARELETQRKGNLLKTDASLALFLERLGREHHDEKAIALGLNSVGVTEESARHWNTAAALYEEALVRARTAGDDATVADSAYGLSFVHRALGYGDAVLPDLLEARSAAGRSGKREFYALVVNAIALWKRNHGDLDEALADFRETRAIFEARGDVEGLAGTLNNLGTTYRELGDDLQAAKEYEQAIAYAEKGKNERLVAYALNNLGAIRVSAHDFDRARAAFERSLELKKKVHDPTAASSEINLGEIARRQHRSADAFRWYEQALADAHTNWDSVTNALCDLAQLALDDGRPHMALDVATRAASLSKTQKMFSSFSAAMAMRGHALVALGQPLEARAAFDEAIASIEDARAHATSSAVPQRALFLEPRLDPYFGAASLLRKSDPAAALAYAEKTKARVLLDSLLPSGGTKLAKDEAALEFVTAEEETIVFIVTSAQVRTRRIALAGPALAHEVQTLRERIAQRDLRADDTAAQLFQKLLGSSWPLVSGAHRLVIIPDGPLWELPFAALKTADGHYLVEHASITYAPSLGARAAMRARARTREASSIELLAFGSAAARDGLPPLPEAEEQARKVAALYGSHGRVYAGDQATETRLKNEIAGARIVHIATHGALNDANPMYSHLLLAADGRNDGILTAREIVRLPLHSELAVLSACETARGRTHQGEGVVGLAWSFFLAGCPSTVVSQWSVDAATTTSLMLAFHRRLRDGATKSDALRDAALSVLHDPKSRHPFYWAPFVLIGDDARVVGR